MIPNILAPGTDFSMDRWWWWRGNRRFQGDLSSLHLFYTLFLLLIVSACNVGDLGLIPGSGRSPGEGNGNPLQYSCLENPMDGGAWLATVHGVAKSQTRLSDFTFTFTFHLRSLCIRSWRLGPPGLVTHHRSLLLNCLVVNLFVRFSKF